MDTCNFWIMKYSWKGGCLILQEDWINNTCGEGTAGRGGAVFNCPSAWRISQSLTASGRKQTDTQTYFHQCCFCILFPSVASILCMYSLFAPLSSEIYILIHYSLSVSLACCFLGKFLGQACLCWCFPTNVQLLCTLCCIYVLRLRPRVQRLVTIYLVQLCFFFFLFCFFCQASLSLRNVTPYLFSRPEEARTGQASNQCKCWFQFWIWYALNPYATLKVI